MSYLILYDKQFVKLSNGEVIPLVLSGSSNCFDSSSGNARRARGWEPWTYRLPKGSTFGVRPEVLLVAIQEEIDCQCAQCATDPYRIKEGTRPSDILAHFGNYAGLSIGGANWHAVTAARYRSFFANGIKGAMTVEELWEIGVGLQFFTNDYYFQYSEPHPDRTSIKTETQYTEHLGLWDAWKAATIVIHRRDSVKLAEPAHFSITFDDHDQVISGKLVRFRRQMRSGGRHDNVLHVL